MSGPDKGRCNRVRIPLPLFGARVLCDSLGTFGNGVLSQFTWQQQTNGGLYLAAADGRTLVVVRKTRRLAGYSLEHVVDERVHDAHGFAGNSSIRMNLLKHLVDVDAKALLPFRSPLLFAVLRRLLFHQLFTTFGGYHLDS